MYGTHTDRIFLNCSPHPSLNPKHVKTAAHFTLAVSIAHFPRGTEMSPKGSSVSALVSKFPVARGEAEQIPEGETIDKVDPSEAS